MAVETLVLEKIIPVVQKFREIKPIFVAPKKRAYDTLPYEDDEVLETNWHRNAMNNLIEIIIKSWQGSKRAFAGGNMFVYFDPNQVKKHNFRGPDFFVVKDVDPDPERKSWVIWDEDYRVPNVVIELSSPSTKEVDFREKKDQYEQILKVKDYFIYDPDSKKLVGWRLQGGVYVELKPNDKGWLWCEELDLWVGVHKSRYHNQVALFPRFFDKNGQLLLNGEELIDQAQLNVEQERREKEQERHEKEQERREKEQAQLKAEQAQLKAEQAQLKAEQEQREKERLIAKLRELGIDPLT
jgi:Uma2 family endonuclease